MTIRRQPSDFQVREALAPERLASFTQARTDGLPHAVYALHKTSLTTLDAVAWLAKALGVKVGSIAYAGLKDKHAETWQHTSIEWPAGGDAPPHVSGKGFDGRLLGWTDRPVSADDIVANNFRIVVRDLSPQASAEMLRRAKLLAIDDELLVINYFGAQRFGSARHGEGFLAKHLIRGDFESALKLAIGTPARKDSGKTRDLTRACARLWGNWAELVKIAPKCPERRAIETLAAGGSFADAFTALPYFTQQMSVEAFQSHLWNATARLLAESIMESAAADYISEFSKQQSPGNGKPPTPLRTDDEFGQMVFPPAAFVPHAWRSVILPLLAPKTTLTDPWKTAAEQVLADEGITTGDLKIPGIRRPFFGEAPRPLFIAARGFSMSPDEKDELSAGKRLKRTLIFDLPRGAYATVVLRALGQ